MKNFIVFLFFSFILVNTDTEAQIRFQKTYGGSGDDFAKVVTQTSDGGYLLCGYTTSFGNGMKDVYVIKTDSNGIKQWSKTFGGSLDDEATCVAEDSGGYLIGGVTFSFGAGGRDGFLAYLNSAGNMVWFKTYGTPANDYDALRFHKTIDNGVIIAYPFIITSFYKYTLIKTDSIGNIQWTKSYGVNMNVTGNVVQCPDSGYLVLGYTIQYGSGQEDFLIAKTDSSGNIVWIKTFGTSVVEGGGYYLKILNNSEAFIIGVGRVLVGTDDMVYMILNYNTGTIVWAKEYAKAGKYLRPFSGTTTMDNGFASDIYDYSVSQKDMGILKTDSLGNIMWVKKYGGTADDVAYCIWNTTDNGFALAGYTTSFGAGGKDIYFVKTDSQGLSGPGTLCNETADTLVSGLYVNNVTFPTVPLASPAYVTNNFSVVSNPSNDSTGALCACLSTSLLPFNQVCVNASLIVLSGGSPPGGMYSGAGVNGGTFDPAVAGIGTHGIMYSYSGLNGCADSSSSPITVIGLPGNFISGDHVLCEGETLTLQVTNPDLANYQWSGPGNFLSTTNEIKISPVFMFHSGVYLLSASSACGISADSFDVSVQASWDNLVLPNVFSPNSDFINDRYSMDTLQDFEMKIFNRWGEELAILTPSKRFWDGTYSGKLVPVGVYVYIIEGRNCKGESTRRTGTINLFR